MAALKGKAGRAALSVRLAASAFVVVVTGAVVLAACGASSSTPPTTDGLSGPGDHASAGQFTLYAGQGPYAAGTQQMIVHGDRVIVWYPVSHSATAGHATTSYDLRSWLPPAVAQLVPQALAGVVHENAYTGLPMAPGHFPVVLFSHGYGSYPEQSSFLTTKLAQWGFIVVAPDQTARDLSAVILGKASGIVSRTDVRQEKAALAEVLQLGDRRGSLFDGHVLRKAAIVGHSAGGYTAVETAATDPMVKVVVAMAGVPVPRHFFRHHGRRLTVLLMAGGNDKVVPPSGILRFYHRLRGTKGLLIIDRAGHNAFDDVCTIGHSEGGVAAIAKSLNFPVPPALLALASDGCKAPDLYPPKLWPLIEQATIAELRYGLGLDPTPVGLGAGLSHAFAGVSARYLSSTTR